MMSAKLMCVSSTSGILCPRVLYRYILKVSVIVFQRGVRVSEEHDLKKIWYYFRYIVIIFSQFWHSWT